MTIAWNVLPAIVVGLLMSVPAIAQTSEGDELPALEIPAHLKVYTDIDKVLGAVGQTIDLVATAKYNIDLATVRDECRKDEVLSVFRGAVVALGAHKAFVNTMEIGWPTMDRKIAWLPKADQPTSDYRAGYPALTHQSRQILWAFWNSERIQRVAQDLERVRALPAGVKADLRAFAEFLLRGRSWYEMIRDRAPDRWFRTLDSQQSDYDVVREFRRNEAQRTEGSAFSDAAFAQDWPILYNENLSLHLNELYEAVRGPSDKPINDCFVGIDQILMKSRYDEANPGKFDVTFGEDGQLIVANWVLPLRYVVFFWHRRHQEGSTDLADALLRRGITLLSETP